MKNLTPFKRKYWTGSEENETGAIKESCHQQHVQRAKTPQAEVKHRNVWPRGVVINSLVQRADLED